MWRNIVKLMVGIYFVVAVIATMWMFFNGMVDQNRQELKQMGAPLERPDAQNQPTP